MITRFFSKQLIFKQTDIIKIAWPGFYQLEQRGADSAIMSKSAFVAQAHTQIVKVGAAMRREFQA